MFCVQSDKDSLANATQLPFWADQICSFSRDHIAKLLPQAQVCSRMAVKTLCVTTIQGAVCLSLDPQDVILA
jgi:hypothetical protein